MLASRITGWTAVALAPVLPLLSIVKILPFDWAQHVDPNINLAFWAAEAGLVITYLIPQSEMVRERLDAMASRSAQGVEVFRHSDDLLKRIADLTIDAEHVATLNLSPAPSSSAPLGKYFTRVDSHLARNRSRRTRSFRSIGSCNDKHKVIAMIKRSRRLTGSDWVSLAVLPPVFSMDRFSFLGLHLVKRAEGCASFIFPRIQPSTTTQGILLFGQDIYDILIEYYNELWYAVDVAQRILEGGHLNDPVIRSLMADFSISEDDLSA